MAIIKHDSVELYAESFGIPSNPPILLVAGAMAPAVFWDTDFCRRLAKRGYLVIRFDNRDIGRSTHFPQSAPDSGIRLPYGIGDMVADTDAVLRYFSDQPGYVIGHSLGGSIAQLFTVAHPETVKAAVFISSPILAYGPLAYRTPDPAVIEELWGVLTSNPMYQDYERGAPEFLKVWKYLNGGWDVDEAMANAYTRALYETETIGPAWNHTNVQQGIPDIYNELKALSVPLLFIHGEQDFLPAHPANTRLLAEHLPGAEFFPLERGGHMFFNHAIWDILLQQILMFTS